MTALGPLAGCCRKDPRARAAFGHPLDQLGYEPGIYSCDRTPHPDEPWNSMLLSAGARANSQSARSTLNLASWLTVARATCDRAGATTATSRAKS